MKPSFNLYAITGNAKYRDLGYRFEHHKIFDPLAADEDKLDGNHANTNIPKVIGAARGYELTGDDALSARSAKTSIASSPSTTPTAPAAPATAKCGTRPTPSPRSSAPRLKSAAAPTT